MQTDDQNLTEADFFKDVRRSENMARTVRSSCSETRKIDNSFAPSCCRFSLNAEYIQDLLASHLESENMTMRVARLLWRHLGVMDRYRLKS